MSATEYLSLLPEQLENPHQENHGTVLTYTTPLQQAIESGDGNKVKDILGAMSENKVKRQLRATYGGIPKNPRSPDDRDLYARTSPVLHAARRGDVSVFLEVLRVMRKKLGPEFKEIMMKADEVGRNLLVMVALSGHQNAFGSVLRELHTDLGANEVQGMMTSRDSRGFSLVMAAVESGKNETVSEVLTTVQSTLTTNQVQGILRSMDTSGRSLLMAAVESGNTETFWEVVIAVADILPEEVQGMMTSRDSRGFSLVMAAVESGKNETVSEVLTQRCEVFSWLVCPPRHLVEAIVKSKDTRGRSLLMAVVESGNNETVRKMLTAVKTILPVHEMQAMMRSKDERGRSLLMAVVESGNSITVSDVLAHVEYMLPPEEVQGMMTSKDTHCRSLLMAAVESGKNETVFFVRTAVTDILPTDEAQGIMRSKDARGYSLNKAAVESGNTETVLEVLTAATDILPTDEAKTAINSVLAMAFRAGSKEVFLATKKALETVMTEIEVYELIAPKAFLGCDLLLTALRIDSATEGAEPLGLLKTFLASAGNYLRSKEEVSPQDDRANPPGRASGPNVASADCTQENARTHSVEDIPMKDEVDGRRMLWRAIRLFEMGLFLMTPVVVEHNLVDKKAAKTLQGIFEDWQKQDDDFQKLDMNSCYGEVGITSEVINGDSKKLLREFLDRLATKGRLLDWVRTCLAGPLVSSKNPFVNGMTLSVEFARAADMAPEGERRNLSSLHNCVNGFLLEVLERLPQTVMGFKGGMSGCENMLLSKVQGKQPPLHLMMKQREQRQMFCMAPLVMDFLTRRFSKGLPNFQDDGDILGDKTELKSLIDFILGAPEDCNADNSSSVLLGKGNLRKHMSDGIAFLQGGYADLPGLAGIPYFGGLPGLQFIVAGLVDKSSSYYRVPAMRMAMHFVVYIAMLVLFYKWVLLRDDATLAWQETFFFVAFVAAGVLREGYEIARDVDAYFSDGWNILDLSSLAVLLAAFIVRCADSDNPWGHALYALSAPLICSRVLFFAQILRFQGPMIQVIFSMMDSLIQFGVIMVVIILGFVMAFRALFLDIYSESDTWRNLFKAMLGDLELFDELEDDTNHSVATVLLVVYLLVITVVLLNLLIAVLSTSHSRVEENAEQEFRDAKIRIFQFYETAVEENLFPAPFNLLQLLFTFPFKVVDFVLPNPGRACGIRADECFGQLVFRLVLCPVAFAVGVLLWLLSSVRAPFVWYLHYSAHPATNAQVEDNDNTEKLTRGLVLLRCIAIFLWCIFVAPAWLLFLLLRQLFRQLFRCAENVEPNRSVQPERDSTESIDVHDMLANAPGGVGARDLFMYLQDPMDDPEVRTDEIDRRTTVRHVKLLRNRLEATTKEEVEKACRKIAAQNDETKRKLEEIFDMMRKNKSG